MSTQSLVVEVPRVNRVAMLSKVRRAARKRNLRLVKVSGDLYALRSTATIGEMLTLEEALASCRKLAGETESTLGTFFFKEAEKCE